MVKGGFMKLIFKGATRTVTGSKHIVETKKGRLLLDCGMFQGKRKEAYEINKAIDGIEPGSIDKIILSHAHIDHSGNIPTFVKRGYKGDIVCTHATRDLVNAMLRDSAHIQEMDVKYVNKKREKKGQALFEPLYTMDDALNSLQYFVSYNYGREFKIFDDVSVKFYDAGHILGSAMTLIKEGDTHLLFTGDLGRKNLPILRDPEKIDERVDYLIIESTYGDRLHDDIKNIEEDLATIVNEAIKRGGKIIVPSFSVGRTQELVFTLNKLYKENKIPQIPIYVDSPLSVNVTSIFRLHPECFDRETHDFLINEGDPFGFETLRYISNVIDSKKLNSMDEPMMIISASGMCEAGRILHHLKNNIEDEKNTVLFVGYQAENTLGRKILDGNKIVKIFGEEYEVKASIKRLDSLSAHADKNDLLEFVDSIKENLKKIFVVHGEEKSALAFAETLRAHTNAEVFVPKKDDVFEIE